MKKHLLSFAVLFVFLFFALASAVNKIHLNAFNYSNKVEDASEKGNYLVKTDGSKIYGSKISWKAGVLVKDQIKIDDEKFTLDEVRGYLKDNVYYARKGNDFIRRIVHGKINVYVQFTEVTQTSSSPSGGVRSRTYTRTDHYAQVGEDGPMIGLPGQKQIKQVVADCPLAVEMADISDSQMRKAIKKDPNYLNSIFDVYNNGCK
jgi:hypothetical protein